MKINHYVNSKKPKFIEVYYFYELGEITLDYSKEEWNKNKTCVIGKWNIKYKTND